MTGRRSEAAREQMRARWADPERATRMRANLEKGRGHNRKAPPGPPAPPADLNAPPPAVTPPAPESSPPRRHPAAAVLTATPRDLWDRLTRR